jgi:hypothetical protein
VNVKGSALRARLRYIDKHGGKGAMARVVENLAPDTRRIVDANILPSNWYPFTAFIDLSETIDRTLGSGDTKLCYALGRFACDENLPTLYKIFFRISDVHHIIRRAASAWRVNYDQGSISVVKEADHFVVLRMEVPRPHRAHCLSVLAWVVRAGELSGAKDVATVERCRLRGDDACEFEMRWR